MSPLQICVSFAVLAGVYFAARAVWRSRHEEKKKHWREVRASEITHLVTRAKPPRIAAFYVLTVRAKFTWDGAERIERVLLAKDTFDDERSAEAHFRKLFERSSRIFVNPADPTRVIA